MSSRLETIPVDGNPQDNNFGFLRLLFAGLVVVSHAPEIIDGDRSREPLSRLFGTASFGVLALDCFFLISGFLITKSWMSQPKLVPFLVKRILRIHPGFIVASLISVFIVGPIAARGFASLESVWFPTLRSIAKIYGPSYPLPPVAFEHHPVLNSPTWTIRWEFKCYLLAAFGGFVGLTRLRWPWLVTAASALAAMALNDRTGIDEMSSNLVTITRFGSFFSVGSVFYLYRDRIVYNRVLAAVAAVGLVVSLCFPVSTQFGIGTFGAYLLFSSAFAKVPAIEGVGTRVDVSYGLYLYAWPIQQLLFLYFPGLPLLGQIVATLALGLLAGYLSWQLVEKHALNLKRFFPLVSKHRRRVVDALRSQLRQGA